MSATEVAITSWGVHDFNKTKHIFQVELKNLQQVVLINLSISALVTVMQICTAAVQRDTTVGVRLQYF